MERVINKWWFYFILILIAFVPSITENPVAPDQITLVIKETLQNPLAYEKPFLFPISKLILIVLLVGPIIWKNKFKIPFVILLCFQLSVIMAFQNISTDTQFGYTILTGNILMQLVVLLSWVYELKVKRIDFSEVRLNWWKALIIALSLLSFWMPSRNGQMYFSGRDIMLNEAGLTYCMVTPFILAILLLYYPSINKVTLRITSFVGLYFGIMNMLTWFVIDPEYWWMGILHLPLLIISFIGLLLSWSLKLKLHTTQ